MKNKRNLWGILGLMAIIALLLAGCPTDSGSSSKKDPGPDPDPGSGLTIEEMNEGDFGKGAVIKETKTFSTAADLENYWMNNINAAGNYVINITANITLSNPLFFITGVPNVVISLRGNGKILTSVEENYVLYLDSQETVIIRNITLKGVPDSSGSYEPVVFCDVGATLIMEEGSVITGGSDGVILRGGSFAMNAGEIYGAEGVGVDVDPGKFDKYPGGVIYGNNLTGKSNTVGAVYVYHNGGSLYRDDNVVSSEFLNVEINSSGNLFSQSGTWY